MSVSDIIYSVSESGSVGNSNQNSSKFSAMVNKTLPECKFFDFIRSKSKMMSCFSKWRFETTLRLKKQEKFRTFIQDPTFDIGLRIDSIKEASEKVQLYNAFRRLKTERNIAIEGGCFQASMRHIRLCKSFNVWQSKLTGMLNRRTQIQLTKVSVSKNERVSDIMRQLHEAIADQAELSIASEGKDKELSDVSALIFDTQKRIKESSDAMNDAINDNRRVNELRKTIDTEYKDQIAQLKMQIVHTKESGTKQLEAARNNLKQRQQAMEQTSESLIISKDEMQQRLTDVMQKLEKTQYIAMNLRDELVKCNIEQQNEEDECMQMKNEIDQLTEECERLETITNNFDNESLNSVESLKQMYNKAQDAKKLLYQQIQENQQSIEQQNFDIEKINKQLAFIKQHAMNTEYAFAEEEEDF